MYKFKNLNPRKILVIPKKTSQNTLFSVTYFFVVALSIFKPDDVISAREK